MSDLPGASGQLAALYLLIGAGTLFALSGVPGLLLDRHSLWGQRLATVFCGLGSLAGLAGALWQLLAIPASGLDLPSPFPGLRTALAVDALSAWFVVPVLLVGGLGSLYATAYWPARRHPHNGRRLRLCYGLLVASLVFILLARDGTSFLIAWEVMALTNFFLVTIEENDLEVRRAGWLYLLYSHVTILGLFAFFLLQLQLTGVLGFGRIAAAASPGVRTAIFLLALVAFGIKAGVMPLHSWLPSAHASAPSHVSAVMSGVVIKMGVYGLVRTTGLFDDLPLAWGATMLVLGAVAAFFGVVFALSQHDLKRLLAYHSIENIGIILLGLGLAMVG
ncbi:MAG: proton-conducting transporter membrane subunit, partial [Thermoanaerobaculia bacterium]